jgi:hypothetical protein
LQLINSQQPDKEYFRYRCGNWRFFGGGKENGWKTVGVEPSDKARAIEKSSFFVEDTLGLESLFDVITMWHVLEHVLIYMSK